MSLIQSAQIVYMFPVCKTKLLLLLHLACWHKKAKYAKGAGDRAAFANPTSSTLSLAIMPQGIHDN